MSHLKIIFTSILFLSLLPRGQSTGPAAHKADSLEQELASLPPDTNRVDVFNELAWLYRNTDIPKARKYAQQGLALARTLPYKMGIADAYTRLGVLSKNEEKYDSALAWYEKGLEIRLELKAYALVASSLLNIANVYKKKGDLKGAINTYKRGLNMLPEDEGQQVRAKIYNRLGNIYIDQGYLEDALRHFEEARKIGARLKDTILTAGIMLSIGELELEQNYFEEGLRIYEEAMALYRKKQYPAGILKCHHNIGNAYYYQKQYDKALESFNACLSLMNQLGITKEIDKTYNSIGAVHEGLGRLDSALYFYQLSLDMRREAGKELDVARSLLNTGQVKLAQKRYKEALADFLEALPMAEEKQDVFTLEALYGQTAQSYYVFMDFENAFLFAQKQRAIAEQLKVASRQTVKLQRALEAEKQNREIAEKEKAVAQKEIEKKTVRAQALGGILILATALFIAVFVTHRMRNKKEMAEREARLAGMQIDEVMKGQELRSAYDKLQGQELERKRIAKDLHDRLGSMLSTVKLYFKALDKRSPFIEEPQVSQYSKAKSLLDDACEELRRVSHNLESGGLKEYGLVRQVAALAENLESSQLLKVDFHTHGLKSRLSLETEVSIYRIIQELVANVLKHAKATELTIQLNKLNGTLNIMVEDNGIGFTRESVGNKYIGIGIKNIAERVNELDGNLSIDSGKGGGTTVSIDLPFKDLEE